MPHAAVRQSSKARFVIGEPVQGSPCVAAGRMVIAADDGVVYCFGGEKK